MKKLPHLFGALCLSAALFCGSETSAQASLPPSPTEAVRQAEASLGQALQWINPDDIDLYGFQPTDDFSAIRIGKPIYQQHFSNPDGAKQELSTSAVLLPLFADRLRDVVEGYGAVWVTRSGAHLRHGVRACDVVQETASNYRNSLHPRYNSTESLVRARRS